MHMMRKETFQALVRMIVTQQRPSRPHALTPSRPHALTPSRPHALTPSRPHALTPSRPHALTPSRPHALTPSRLGHALNLGRTFAQPHNRTTAQPHNRTTAQTVAPVPAPGTLFAPPTAGAAGRSGPVLPHARRLAFAHVEGGAPGILDELRCNPRPESSPSCEPPRRDEPGLSPSLSDRLRLQAYLESRREAGSEIRTFE